MKRVICNHCRREEPMDAYGLAPDGWFRVNERNSTKFVEDPDYCSLVCLVRAVESDLLSRDIAQRSAVMAATEIALTDTEQAF